MSAPDHPSGEKTSPNQHPPAQPGCLQLPQSGAGNVEDLKRSLFLSIDQLDINAFSGSLCELEARGMDLNSLRKEDSDGLSDLPIIQTLFLLGAIWAENDEEKKFMEEAMGVIWGKSQINLNLQDEETGYSLFHRAVEFGDGKSCREGLDMLLRLENTSRRRIDRNLQDFEGLPAVFRLIYRTSIYKVDLEDFRNILKDGEFDLNTKCRQGMTVFHFAALNSVAKETMEELLHSFRRQSPDTTVSEPILSAFINIPDLSGATALHYAIIGSPSGNPEVLKLLLDAGADPNAKVTLRNTHAEGYEITPLHLATTYPYERSELITALLERNLTPGINLATKPYDHTPFHLIAKGLGSLDMRQMKMREAVRNAAHSMVTLILNIADEEGVEANALDGNGWSVFHHLLYIDPTFKYNWENRNSYLYALALLLMKSRIKPETLNRRFFGKASYAGRSDFGLSSTPFTHLLWNVCVPRNFGLRIHYNCGMRILQLLEESMSVESWNQLDLGLDQPSRDNNGPRLHEMIREDYPDPEKGFLEGDECEIGNEIVQDDDSEFEEESQGWLSESEEEVLWEREEHFHWEDGVHRDENPQPEDAVCQNEHSGTDAGVLRKDQPEPEIGAFQEVISKPEIVAHLEELVLDTKSAKDVLRDGGHNGSEEEVLRDDCTAAVENVLEDQTISEGQVLQGDPNESEKEGLQENSEGVPPVTRIIVLSPSKSGRVKPPFRPTGEPPDSQETDRDLVLQMDSKGVTSRLPKNTPSDSVESLRENIRSRTFQFDQSTRLKENKDESHETISIRFDQEGGGATPSNPDTTLLERESPKLQRPIVTFPAAWFRTRTELLFGKHSRFERIRVDQIDPRSGQSILHVIANTKGFRDWDISQTIINNALGLNHGVSVDFNLRDRKGYTAIHYAIIRRKLKLVEQLINTGKIDFSVYPSWKWEDNVDDLHQFEAPKDGSLLLADDSVVREVLIPFFMKKRSKEVGGDATAEVHAIHEINLKAALCIEGLLERTDGFDDRGVLIYKPNKPIRRYTCNSSTSSTKGDGLTGLHFVAYFDEPELIPLLLERKESTSSESSVPLAQENTRDLLVHPIDINARFGPEQLTPLHLMVKLPGGYELLREFLKKAPRGAGGGLHLCVQTSDAYFFDSSIRFQVTTPRDILQRRFLGDERYSAKLRMINRYFVGSGIDDSQFACRNIFCKKAGQKDCEYENRGRIIDPYHPYVKIRGKRTGKWSDTQKTMVRKEKIIWYF